MYLTWWASYEEVVVFNLLRRCVNYDCLTRVYEEHSPWEDRRSGVQSSTMQLHLFIIKHVNVANVHDPSWAVSEPYCQSLVILYVSEYYMSQNIKKYYILQYLWSEANSLMWIIYLLEKTLFTPHTSQASWTVSLNPFSNGQNHTKVRYSRFPPWQSSLTNN